MKHSSTQKPRMKLPGIMSSSFPHLLTVQILVLALQTQLHLSYSSLLAQNETDRLSLLVFKDHITSDPFHILDSWNDSSHFCQWYGVTCGRRHQRVVKLHLESYKLGGSLTQHTGNLSFLRILNLGNNSLSQGIPQELGRLSRLQELSLYLNMFTGDIPITISHCSKLHILDLGLNNLTGKLPKQLGSLKELQLLVFEKNNLVGEIPPSLGNLSSLWGIYGRDNTLSGKIPDDIGKLKRLSTLALGSNNLSGIIPPSIYNLSSLVNFSVPDNQLTGTLPSNLGQALPVLERFYFSMNHFSGIIPTSFSNSSSLMALEVGFNSFVGRVPNLDGVKNLKSLKISDNNLGNGEKDDLEFLQSLVNKTFLKVLDFSMNNLSGLLPATISNFSTTLNWLGFRGNRVGGSIPTEIGNLVGLQNLNMGSNQLTGTIPISIGKLTNLVQLFIYNNRLSGTIPTSLGNLTMLYVLNLGSNYLHGSIPLSVQNCHGIAYMALFRNSLSGSIEVISGLPSLVELYLENNQLNGTIPLEYGKLVSLNYLDVSSNKLSGEIPGSLGTCVALEFLLLGANFFEGKIPDSLQSLRGLQYCNLSYNHLSGIIPKFLGNLSLVGLDLSFNDFIGEVPVDGIFGNESGVSVEGNKHLCGGAAFLLLPGCPNNNPTGTSSTERNVFIPVACAIVGAILMACLILAYSSRKKCLHHKSPSMMLSTITFPKVSYQDLLKATENFAAANLIGIGGFGSVYKGYLEEETTVAVKVLNLQQKGSTRSFVAECEALSKIRHRNLVRVLTACSSIDFQGNDFKALVYEYMENGSLENWLHPAHTSNQEKQHRYLNFIQRLNISIDVASALEYMHHHCQQLIVHCDLKPSNILLDGEFVAHVGDFGLARLIQENDDHLLSSNPTSSIGVKGTVGYAAPEYGEGSEASTYGDMYSYGILLLEMFTGKRPTDNIFKDDLTLHSFVDAALPHNVLEITDPTLLSMEENVDATLIPSYKSTHCRHERFLESLSWIFKVGILCSASSQQGRMNATSVVTQLSYVKRQLLETRVKACLT